MRTANWTDGVAISVACLAACGGGGSDNATALAPSPAASAPAPAPVASPEGFFTGPTIAAPTAGSSGREEFAIAAILVDGNNSVWASYDGPGHLATFAFYSITSIGGQDATGTMFRGQGEWFRPGTVVSAFARQYVLGIVQDQFGNWVLSGAQLPITGSFVEKQRINAPPVQTAQFTAGFPYVAAFDTTPLVVAERVYPTAWMTVPGYLSATVSINVVGNALSADIGVCHVSGAFTPTGKNYNYVSMTFGDGCGIPANLRTFIGVVAPGSDSLGIAGTDGNSSLLLMAKNTGLKVMVGMY
jgi:hypothetical protein